MKGDKIEVQPDGKIGLTVPCTRRYREPHRYTLTLDDALSLSRRLREAVDDVLTGHARDDQGEGDDG